MATLTIGDRSVTVDDAFLSLPADQQSATVEEIAASLGVKAPPAPASTAGDTGKDVAKSAGVGVGKGLIGLAGLPMDLSELGARGIDAATRFTMDKLGLEPGEARKHEEPALGSAHIKKMVEGVTGEFYKPQTTAGEYAETVGEFAPGLIGGPAGLGRRALTQVVAPGVASEAAGQATKDTAAEPYARVAGALAGGLAPSLAGRLVTPLPIDPTRQAMVNALRNEGVTDLTAGQITGRKPLQYLEAERGRGAGLMESQAEQFTAAALRRVGENANRATPEVIDGAFTRIGQQFDDLASRNAVQVDRQFAGDVARAQSDYNFLANPLQRQVLNEAINDVIGVIQRNNGVIPGPQYQAMRSRLDKAARASSGTDNQLSDAMFGIRNAMDDAMERSIAVAGNPADLGAWREARRQYRDMLVIERAATGAGEGAALGLISPAKLREATVAQGRRGYARGRGDFSELARAGVATMAPLPNSGTPGRISAQNLGAGVSSLLGGAAGAAAGGGSEGTMAGMIAGALMPRAVGRTATSGLGRRYLANQVAGPMLTRLDPQRAALINALIAAQQQRPELAR